MEPAQAGSQAEAVKDVVPQHQCHGIAADVIGADDERLGQTVGLVLDRVAQIDPERRPVAEQPAKSRCVVGGADHQDVADAGHDQRGQRVVDQRLVVDGQQPAVTGAYAATTRSIVAVLAVLNEQVKILVRSVDRGPAARRSDGIGEGVRRRRCGLPVAVRAWATCTPCSEQHQANRRLGNVGAASGR